MSTSRGRSSAAGQPYPTLAALNAITEELTKLEGRVDDLHDIGLKELFLKYRSANTMDFIVGAEIYDHLEKVADRFDDVANEITVDRNRTGVGQWIPHWASRGSPS